MTYPFQNISHSNCLANEETREKEGNASNKVLAKVFKMRKWRKKKETRVHFFQTADAVETALGKDISQSGATFYLIYSNTSTKYLTLYLNILQNTMQYTLAVLRERTSLPFQLFFTFACIFRWSYMVGNKNKSKSHFRAIFPAKWPKKVIWPDGDLNVKISQKWLLFLLPTI